MDPCMWIIIQYIANEVESEVAGMDLREVRGSRLNIIKIHYTCMNFEKN